MLGQKPKQPEQGTVPGRQVQRSGGVNPAFSYYNRRSPHDVRHPEAGRPKPSKPRSNLRRYLLQTKWSAAPFWLLVGLIVLCGLKVLSLSTNPRVVIVGNSAVATRYLQPSNVYASAAHKLLTRSITNRSKITVNLEGTALQLQREFPELQTVSLGMPLISNRPIVYVQPAQPSVIVQNGSGVYALNQNGVVLSKLPAPVGNTPIAIDQTDGRILVGKQYLPSSTVVFVQTLTYQLNAAHMPISTLTLPSSAPYEIDFHVSGQTFTVRCNLAADATVQSGAVIATVQHLGNHVPANYLDVRTPGRVYYK